MRENKTRAEKRVEKLVAKAKKSIDNRGKDFYVAPEITDNSAAMLELTSYIIKKYYGYDFQRDEKVNRLANLIDKKLFENRDFVLQASEITYQNYGTTFSLLNHVDGSAFSKRIVLDLVNKNPENLKRLNAYKGDEDVVMAAVRQDGNMLEYAIDAAADSYDIVRIAIGKEPLAIQYAADKFKDDKQLGTFAVSKNGRALRYLSDRLKDDKDIVLIAVKDKEAFAIAYASDRLKDDVEVATASVKANGDTLKGVSVERRSQHEIVSYAIAQSPALIKEASNRYLYSEPLLFKAVLQNAAVLEYIPEEMRKPVVEMLDNYSAANPNVTIKAGKAEREDEADL